MPHEEFLIVAKPHFETNSSGGSELSIVDVWLVPDNKQTMPLAGDRQPGSPPPSPSSSPSNFDRYSFYRSRQPAIPAAVQHMVMYRTPAGWQMASAPASVPPYLPDGRTISGTVDPRALPPYAGAARGFNPAYPNPNYPREYSPPMSSSYRDMVDAQWDAMDRARLVQEMRRRQMQDMQTRIYGPRPGYAVDSRTVDPRTLPPGYRVDPRAIDPRTVPPGYRVDPRTIDPRTVPPDYRVDPRTVTVDPRVMPGYRTTVPDYRPGPGYRTTTPDYRTTTPDYRTMPPPPDYRTSGPIRSYEPEPTLARTPDFTRPVYENPQPYRSRARYGVDPAVAARIAERDRDLRRDVIAGEYDRWSRMPGGGNYRVDPRASGDFDLQRTIMELSGRGSGPPTSPPPPTYDPRGPYDPRGGALDPRAPALDPRSGAYLAPNDSAAWSPDPKNLRRFQDRLDFDPTGTKVPESVGNYLRRYGPPGRPGSGSRPPGPDGAPAAPPSTMNMILGGVKDFLMGN